MPAVLSSAGYFCGVVAEYVHGDHDKAVALFTASAVAGRHHREAQKEDSSPEVIAFETKSLGERAIILARHFPDAAPDALRELDVAAAMGACDTATIDDFKRRAEELLPPRVTRGDQARAWITRVKGGVGSAPAPAQAVNGLSGSVSAAIARGRTRNVFPIIATMVARRMNITAAIALAVDVPDERASIRIGTSSIE